MKELTYLKAILDNSPEGILLLSLEHRVLAFNSTAKSIIQHYFQTELKEGDLYFPTYVAEPFRQSYLEAVEKIKTGESLISERLVQYGEAEYHFEFRLSPVYDAEKELLGVCMIAKNITEQKLAQLKVKELNHQLELVLNNAGESVIYCNTEGQILLVNDIAQERFQRFKGVTSVIGNKLEAYFDDPKSEYLQRAQQAWAGKKSEGEFRHIDLKGEVHWHYSRFEPVYEDDGQLMGAAVFSRDITDKKIFERDLAESEKRFTKITDLAPVGILITDKQLKVSYVNKSIQRLYGYKPEELKGERCTKLFSNLKWSQNDRLILQDIQAEIETPIFNQDRFASLKKNGEKMEVLVSSGDFISKNKLNYIFIIQDITDLHYKEAVINDQITRLKDIAWHQSHVVRGPLARLMGLINLLENAEIKLSHTEHSTVHHAILESARELDQVIFDILSKTHKLSTP